MKNGLIMGGVAVAVFLIVTKLTNTVSSGKIRTAQMTNGDTLDLYLREGFIYDSKGRLWA